MYVSIPIYILQGPKDPPLLQSITTQAIRFRSISNTRVFVHDMFISQHPRGYNSRFYWGTRYDLEEENEERTALRTG